MAATSAILTGLSTVGQVAGQQRQAGAIDAQSSFDQKVAQLNAADAVARGNQAAQRFGMQVRGTIGAERAGFAAQGVDVGSGSALDTQVETGMFGALDEQTIRNNANREAWGITTNATLAKLAAQQEASAVRSSSVDTLITGAAKTYGLYQNRPSRSPSGKLTLSRKP